MTDTIDNIVALGRLNIEEANGGRLETAYPDGYTHYFYIILMPLDSSGAFVSLAAEDVTGMIGTTLNIIKYYDDPGSPDDVSGGTDPFFSTCYSFGLDDKNLFQYVGHFTRNNLLYIKGRTNTVESTVDYYEGFTLAVSFENANGRWACNHDGGSGLDSSISFWQPPGYVSAGSVTMFSWVGYGGSSTTTVEDKNYSWPGIDCSSVKFTGDAEITLTLNYLAADNVTWVTDTYSSTQGDCGDLYQYFVPGDHGRVYCTSVKYQTT